MHHGPQRPRLDGGVDRGADVFWAADVGGDELHGVAEFLGDRLTVGGGQVGDDDLGGTGSDKAFHGRAPEAGGASGDNRADSLNLHVLLFLSRP